MGSAEKIIRDDLLEGSRQNSPVLLSFLPHQCHRMGEGSTFNIFLPVLGEVAAGEIESDAFELYRGEGTILVVDDEPVMRKLASNILEECGYWVITAKNGQEGIELFRERHGSIRAVLLDLIMPVKSGDEAYPEFRRIDENVKVLMASGFRKDERVERALKAGVDMFIQKPYTLEKLSKSIYMLLNSEASD